MPKMGPGKGGSGSGGSSTVPAGDYMLALVWFKRQVGKDSGQDYLRCKWQVIGGRAKGKSFFANISCNLSKEGTVVRWQILMECCGVTEQFELGSTREGNDREGDDNITRLFMHKPIKARVKVETNGGYTNNDLQMLHFRKNWTDEDQAIALKWLDERSAAGGSPEDGYDDPPDSSSGAGSSEEDPDESYTPAGGDESYAGDDDEFDPAKF